MNDQDGFRTKAIVTISIHFIFTIIKLLKRIDDSWCTSLSILYSSKKQKARKDCITDKVGVNLVLSQQRIWTATWDMKSNFLFQDKFSRKNRHASDKFIYLI